MHGPNAQRELVGRMVRHYRQQKGFDLADVRGSSTGPLRARQSPAWAGDLAGC